MHSNSATTRNITDISILTTAPISQYSLRRRLLSGTIGLALGGSFSIGVAHANENLPIVAVTPAIPLVHRTADRRHEHSRQNLGPNWHRIERAGQSPVNNRQMPDRTRLTHFERRNARAEMIQNDLPSANDLALNSSKAVFTAGGLAGFHDITIDIGGKVQHVSIDSKLTAAELVAAQQVLSGGKQEIKLNAKGVGVGGYFDLNTASVAALGDALGGDIGSLYISRGVEAVNSLSSLTLTGALVNRGTIDFAAQTAGQTDTINAASISNRGLIASAGHGNDLVPAAVSLNSTGDFSNTGKISSSSNLRISASNISNSGTLTATNGDVTISGVAGGSVMVDGTGGTVQAKNGNINFNDFNYAGSGDVTVNGGDWISRQFNINDGSGNSNMFVGELTGVTNITAGCSHLTAGTEDLQLGLSNITGDPTYYNTGTATTAGNIIINSDISVTGANDLAIIATGNIIGNGGKITTQSGELTIIAGANITAPAPGNSSLPGSGGDSSTAITISDNGAVAGKGSKFGGYIDLSGITLTGSSTNAAITGVGSASGDVLMVAYKGSGSNSGSIVGTSVAKQAVGAKTIDAGTGSVKMIAGGAQITAQGIQGKDVTVLATVPTVSGGTLTVTDGSVTGSYITTGTTPTITSLNLATITATNNVELSTAGLTSSTAAVPLALTASGLTFNGTGKTSSLFVNSTGGIVLNPTSASTLNGLLAVTAASGNLSVNNDITGQGKVSLTASAGSIVGSGIINGTSATLTTSGNIGTSSVLPLNVAVDSLTVNSTSGAVNVNAGTSSLGLLTILASSAGTGQNFNLTSAQPLLVAGALTAIDGAVSIVQTETTLDTVNGTTKIAGVSVNAAINVGSTTGSISIQTTGNENIINKVALVAPSLNLDTAGAIGTSSAPLLTNTPSLTVNGNSSGSIFVKDLGTGNLAVSGSGSVVSVSIISAASSFNVGELDFSNITVGNTAAGAVTTINPGVGKSVGDGTGLVTIATAGDINQGSGNISGTAIVLASTAGSVGANAALAVTAPDLTANAVKGSVDLVVTGDTNLNAGTALNTYRVNEIGSLNLNGTIKATATKTATGTVDLTVSKNLTQSVITDAISAPIVTLTALAGASVGVGVGFQSIQTKATSALNINGAANSSTFITQTGSISLGNAGSGAANSSLDLTLSSGSKLTVDGVVSFTNVSLTDPTSVAVGSAGRINAANLTVTTPILVVNNTSTAPGSGSINIAAGGAASFESLSSLSITGPGVINLGRSLNLSGQSSITLGDKTTGNNNPLAGIGGTGGGAGPLGDLTIFTKGNFTGAYTQFATSAAFADDTLSISASSLKTLGATSTAPFKLIGNGTNSNSLSLALTGTQAVTVDNTTVANGKQANFDFIVGGTSPGSVSVKSNGVLTVNAGGLNISPASGNSIALSGQSLVVNLPSNEFSGTKYNSVSLGSLLGTFTIGANTATQLKNGIAGTVNAEYITISAPAILIQGQDIHGAQMTFNTSTFNLDSASTITGVPTAKITKPSLSINNTAVPGLIIVGTATAPSGTYSGISSVLIQSAISSINVGQLFTSSSLLGNASVDSIAIAAGSSLTLPATLSKLNVTSNPTSSIYVSAASLLYAPSAKNPQNYLTLSAPTGSVSILVGTELTLGKSRGNIDIDVTNVGSYTVSANKLLTINESLTTASAKITGAGIIFNQDVTTSGAMQVQAQGGPQKAGLGGGFGFVFGTKAGSKKSAGKATTALITTNDSVITAGVLTIGQVNAKTKTTAINVDTPDLRVSSGAIRLSNTYSGDVSLTQKAGVNPLNALTLVNTSGLSSSTLTVGSIITTDGGIDITNTNGKIIVADSANLLTNAGNITILNSDLNGTIEFKQNVVLHSSAVTKGLGIIYIAIGKVPFTNFVTGSQPGPNLPVVNNTLGGRVYYTTSAHPNGTITSIGLNILNAEGRNIIFNGNGNNSAITLDGNVNITADPPAAGASSKMATKVSTSQPAALTNTAASQLQSNSNTAGSDANLPVNAAQISAQMSSQLSARMVGFNALNGLNAGATSTQNPVGVAESRLISGGASDYDTKTLEGGVQLYAPNKLTIVKTSFGAVRLAAGAVAMVMAFDRGLAVYNLHDTKRGAVALAVGNNVKALSPGQSAVFTDRPIENFEEINPAQAVAYRCVTGQNLGNGLRSYKSEFSTISLLQNYDPLRTLYGSKDAETRKTVDSVLKTAAVLHQLGGGQYQRMSAPINERLASGAL